MIDKKSEKPWFLYLIKTANNSLYTGITTDVLRRFKEHQSSKKGAKALRGKGPLSIAFCAQVNSQSEALVAEAWVKKQSKIKKTQIVNGALLLACQHKIVNLEALSK